MDNRDQNPLHLVKFLKEERFAPNFITYEKTRKPVMDKFLFSRSIAFGIDTLILLFIKVSISGTLMTMIDSFFPTATFNQKIFFIQTPLWFDIFIFGMLFISYFFYANYFLAGQTVGKKTMNLIVVDKRFIDNHDIKDHRLSLKDALIKSSAQLLCYASFGTLYIFPFLSEDGRGLSDFLSMTMTLDLENFHSLQSHKLHSQEVIQIEFALSWDQAA